ncbi:putative transporter SVOPL [Amphiura filiformis]|uniref:putative transporter SVOPL n=1 Tax=Amphiura filiformis TaxID=82378 RepID=UPI003B211838
MNGTTKRKKSSEKSALIQDDKIQLNIAAKEADYTPATPSFSYGTEVRSDRPVLLSDGLDNRGQAPSPRKEYTVNDAIEEIGIGYLQIMILAASLIAIMAVGTQILLITTIKDIIRCEFKLTEDESAFISTSLFIGELFGASLASKLIDNYGRRPGLVLIAAWLGFYSLLFVFSPTYGWLIILRFLIGFGAVGLQVICVVYLGEMTPARYRVWFILAQIVFYGLGSVYISTVGYFVLEQMGWRWQSVYSLAPCVMVLMVFWLFPESPRFYALKGYLKPARATLKDMADRNNVLLTQGDLIQIDTVEIDNRGSIRKLLGDGYATQTILLNIVWFCAYFCYYGLALSTSRLLKIPIGGDMPLPNVTDPNDTAIFATPSPVNMYSSGAESMPSNGNCAEGKEDTCNSNILNSEEYLEFLACSVGDILGGPFLIFLVFMFGRRGGMGVAMLLSGTCFLSIVAFKSVIDLTAFIFLARAFTLGVYGTLPLYTVEAYPTTTRSAAMSMGQFFAKLAGALTPFVAESLFEKNTTGAIIIYMLLSVFGGALSCLLPETSGRILKDT